MGKFIVLKSIMAHIALSSFHCLASLYRSFEKCFNLIFPVKTPSKRCHRFLFERCFLYFNFRIVQYKIDLNS